MSRSSTLAPGRPVRTGARARDWAEIQERMLVPLYEAVYDRLGVGPDTRLLGIGCGSGLALLMAAARGAAVTGVDLDEQRLALARERLLPEVHGAAAAGASAAGQAPTLLYGGPERVARRSGALFTVITAFDPSAPAAEPAPALGQAARLAERGSPVVLAGWGPPERCATARVLQTAVRPADHPGRAAGPAPVSGRDDLEELARRAGLRLDGSGRVACPFAYPDQDSAVRGLLSTGLFDAAVRDAGRTRVEEELAEALRPYRRPDGTVRMDNVFRYLIARV